MTDNTELMDVAVAWVERLLARGVTLQVRGQRLAYHPKSAYGQLTNEERATLKEHKTAIIAVVRERYAGTVRPAVTSATAPATPEKAPAPPCRWCYQSPCIGPEHEAFITLHPLEAQQLADEFATKQMMHMVGRPHPWWDGR